MGSRMTLAEAALDALADPLLVCGADGRLSYVNAAACALLGERASELVGRPFESFVPERLRTVRGVGFFEWIAGAYESHRRPIRATLVRHDGVEMHRAFQATSTSCSAT